MVASKHPYYKYNQVWTRDVQNTVCLPVTLSKIKAHVPPDSAFGLVRVAWRRRKTSRKSSHN